MKTSLVQASVMISTILEGFEVIVALASSHIALQGLWVAFLKILKYLEEQEFIEVLNESDPKNIHCRFNKSFLRESIYQVMLYKDQKQTLSKAYAEYLQSLPISNMEDK